jgi:hypothetical protein
MTNPKLTTGTSVGIPISPGQSTHEVSGLLPSGQLNPENIRLLLIYGRQRAEHSQNSGHPSSLVPGIPLIGTNLRNDTAYDQRSISTWNNSPQRVPSYHQIAPIEQPRAEATQRESFQPFASRPEPQTTANTSSSSTNQGVTEARTEPKTEQKIDARIELKSSNENSMGTSPTSPSPTQTPPPEPPKASAPTETKQQQARTERPETQPALKDIPSGAIVNDVQRTIALLFNRSPDTDPVPLTPKAPPSPQPHEHTSPLILNRANDTRLERAETEQGKGAIQSSIKSAQEAPTLKVDRTSPEEAPQADKTERGNLRREVTATPALETSPEQSAVNGVEIAKKPHETKTADMASHNPDQLRSEERTLIPQQPNVPQSIDHQTAANVKQPPSPLADLALSTTIQSTIPANITLENSLSQRQEPLGEVSTGSLRVLAPEALNVNITFNPLQKGLEADLQQQQQQQQIQEDRAQRIERLRDIQQILAVESRESTRSSKITLDQPRSEQHLSESTTVALERLRESIIDRLTGIQSRIETIHSETDRRQPFGSIPRSSNIQGRDSLIKITPLNQSLRANITPRLADRGIDNNNAGQLKALLDAINPLRISPQQNSPLRQTSSADTSTFHRQRAGSILNSQNEATNASSSTAAAFTRVRNATRPIKNSDLASQIIDTLKKFSERSVNFKLLNNMDNSIEKACLTIATGAALGVVGLALLYRATNLVVIQTLRALREDQKVGPQTVDVNPEETDQEQKQLESSLNIELESFTVNQLKTTGDQGFVVDLAGIVVNASDDTPIHGALVKCSEFGVCQTGIDGGFIFTNIPLGAPYTITVSVPGRSIKPLTYSGVCGELGFVRIRV